MMYLAVPFGNHDVPVGDHGQWCTAVGVDGLDVPWRNSQLLHPVPPVLETCVVWRGSRELYESVTTTTAVHEWTEHKKAWRRHRVIYWESLTYPPGHPRLQGFWFQPLLTEICSAMTKAPSRVFFNNNIFLALCPPLKDYRPRPTNTDIIDTNQPWFEKISPDLNLIISQKNSPLHRGQSFSSLTRATRPLSKICQIQFNGRDVQYFREHLEIHLEIHPKYKSKRSQIHRNVIQREMFLREGF